ncbi:unnamed protein product [Cyprideis torosa]|uniref:Uncharacterized protein n=1 Tax=Cyprideis torosa TaxID=163714 RepID=A0A7R8ZGD5_9CRUS|nr:unnamed protein product [Cyprideis torosa]CAG0881421.1 unnamed protein product [Cyprideis torosa]
MKRSMSFDWLVAEYLLRSRRLGTYSHFQKEVSVLQSVAEDKKSKRRIPCPPRLTEDTSTGEKQLVVASEDVELVLLGLGLRDDQSRSSVLSLYRDMEGSSLMECLLILLAQGGQSSKESGERSTNGVPLSEKLMALNSRFDSMKAERKKSSRKHDDLGRQKHAENQANAFSLQQLLSKTKESQSLAEQRMEMERELQRRQQSLEAQVEQALSRLERRSDLLEQEREREQRELYDERQKLLQEMNRLRQEREQVAIQLRNIHKAAVDNSSNEKPSREVLPHQQRERREGLDRSLFDLGGGDSIDSRVHIRREMDRWLRELKSLRKRNRRLEKKNLALETRFGIMTRVRQTQESVLRRTLGDSAAGMSTTSLGGTESPTVLALRGARRRMNNLDEEHASLDRELRQLRIQNVVGRGRMQRWSLFSTAEEDEYAEEAEGLKAETTIPRQETAIGVRVLSGKQSESSNNTRTSQTTSSDEQRNEEVRRSPATATLTLEEGPSVTTGGAETTEQSYEPSTSTVPPPVMRSLAFAALDLDSAWKTK